MTYFDSMIKVLGLNGKITLFQISDSFWLLYVVVLSSFFCVNRGIFLISWLFSLKNLQILVDEKCCENSYIMHKIYNLLHPTRFSIISVTFIFHFVVYMSCSCGYANVEFPQIYWYRPIYWRRQPHPSFFSSDVSRYPESGTLVGRKFNRIVGIGCIVSIIWLVWPTWPTISRDGPWQPWPTQFVSL